MANPQKENGHTAIANEIIEALIRAGLNGTEFSVALYVLRKTYGWQKKEDEISLTQFEKAIPVSRQSIINAIKNLKLVKILLLAKQGDHFQTANRYRFNKDYDSWELVKKSRLVKKSLLEASQNSYKKLVKKSLPTKETIQKKYKKKESIFDFYEKCFKTKKIILRDDKTRIVKLNKRLEKFTIKQIKEAIKNYSKNNFYSGDNGWIADIDWILESDKRIEKGINLKPKNVMDDL